MFSTLLYLTAVGSILVNISLPEVEKLDAYSYIWPWTFFFFFFFEGPLCVNYQTFSIKFQISSWKL